MLTLEFVEAEAEDEVVELAELWLSWLILFLNLSNSEIFLSKLSAAEAADSLSANKELKEAANWLKAASKGSDEAEEGVEGEDEKSRRKDIGELELELMVAEFEAGLEL